MTDLGWLRIPRGVVVAIWDSGEVLAQEPGHLMETLVAHVGQWSRAWAGRGLAARVVLFSTGDGFERWHVAGAQVRVVSLDPAVEFDTALRLARVDNPEVVECDARTWPVNMEGREHG